MTQRINRRKFLQYSVQSAVALYGWRFTHVMLDAHEVDSKVKNELLWVETIGNAFEIGQQYGRKLADRLKSFVQNSLKKLHQRFDPESMDKAYQVMLDVLDHDFPCQLGEGTTYFDRGAVFNAKATSRIIKAESDSALDYIIGDARNIYKLAAGLQKFFRHLVYVKPNIIFILDELKANQPSKFEWMMHTDGGITKGETNKYTITNGDVVMDINFLLPEAIADNHEARLLKIFLSDSVAETLILAAIHIRKSDDPSAILVMGKNFIIDVIPADAGISLITDS